MGSQHEIDKINCSELTPLWGQFFKSTPNENSVFTSSHTTQKVQTPKSAAYRAIRALKPPRVPKTISNQKGKLDSVSAKLQKKCEAIVAYYGGDFDKPIINR